MIDLGNTRVRIGIGIAAAAAIALLMAPGKKEEAVAEDTGAPRPLLLVPADLVTASIGSVAGGVKLTGTLEPLNQTAVNARVGGVVLAVPVREGEAVAQNQLLVQQDASDVRAQLAQAEAQLHSADVDLKLVEAYEKKKTELYEKKYLSEVDWVAAKGETEVKRAQVQIQQAAVDMARKALADADVTAPIAGIVAERHVEPGTRVAPGQALITLVDLGELELAAAIPARDVPQVKTGSEVLFTVDGHGTREFRGRIVRVNPMATSGSRTITVYARVGNADRALRGGMFASGRIAIGNVRKGVLRIPAAAVRRIDGQDQVWVIRNDALALQPVKTGVRDTGTGLLEITDGLREGERVVLTELGNRTPGMPVLVSDPQPARP
ncbi:MAG: efflux RND transporter periplasmic adaptor subunit [Pseudomonadota bacterium]